MSEYTENLKLFQKVLVEASNEKIQLIMADAPKDIVFSKQHEKAMRQILKISQRPSFTCRNRRWSDCICKTKCNHTFY